MEVISKKIIENWHIKQIGEVALKVGSGITPTGGERVYKANGRPFIRSQNVGWGTLLLEDVAYIDESLHRTFESTEVYEGDVLLNITGASIGRSAIATRQIEGGNVNQHVCIIRTERDQLNPTLLNYLLLSERGQKQIESFQAGGNRQGLNFGQIKSFDFAIPKSISEQTAIATALSDADALITSLEKLIAKKRNIKQGAMQQLLKPKKGWEVKRLGDCLIRNPDYGINAASVPYNESLPTYLRITDISEDGKYLTSDKVSVDNIASNTFYLEDGDIVFARTGASVGKTYLYNVKDGKLVFAGFLIRVKTKKTTLDPKYLFYITQTKSYWSWVVANSMRSGQPGLNSNEYKSLEIQIPTIGIQKEIISVLSDMDSEISTLEFKLEKYRQIKSGMMQNLLTGKIRLV